MAGDTIYVAVDTLYNFMRDVFVGIGVPEQDATTCADVLIASDLRGIESHGIGRLKMYYDRIRIGQQEPVTHPQVVRDSPAVAVIDGQNGMGMVIATQAMNMAIEKARAYGIGAVAVRNSNHFGIAGYYSLMAVKAGMIGMTVTNARPSIAPTFGVQPMLGTNPIAFGAPTDEDCPFLLDAATSITQRGKFEVLARADKPAPAGWAIDDQGNPITDPHVVLEGLGKGEAALLPLGGAGELLAGYKGYDLATMVEILSASLQGGSFLYGLIGFDEQGNRQPFNLGHYFMAINIESFVPLQEFKTTTGNILRQLRNSKKEPQAERIYIAGEKEYELEKVIRRQGVPVIPNLQKEIKTMQQELHLNQYAFPF